MERRRIAAEDLAVGKPISWDVFDLSGQLLLGRGTIIASTKQIDMLAERGVYFDVPVKQHRAAMYDPPSVLRTINLVNKQLETVLGGIYIETAIEGKILELAGMLVRATNLSPDIALACILMNQECGVYPIRHSVDTAIVSLLVAQALKKPVDEVLLVTAAAMTMNASMLGLQAGLHSTAAPLTAEQEREIRLHPEESARILRHAGVGLADWLEYVLHHHENQDGSGYPYGKTGEHIPSNAKLISLADRYCARVSSRNYRKSLLPNAALRDMLLAEKATMDPVLATTFLRELGIYPTGTFVRLENGEIGVVTGRGASSTTPVVHALVGPRGAPLSYAIQRDTSKQLYAIRDVLTEDQAHIQVSMRQLWGAAAAL